jgi:rhodanese-related sulfurtransferase
MAWSEEDIQANRRYFEWKLQAIKERNSLVKAIEQGPFDFVLLDTRARDAFTFGHITGAWCAPLEEFDRVLPLLPRDREVVTYCWGHD